MVFLAAILWVSPVASVTVLWLLMAGLGFCLGACSLSFAVAVSGLPVGQGGTVVALVNAAGCLSGALFQELPIWLGWGKASVLGVSIVYLGVALFGVLVSWRMPRESATE